LFSKAALHVDGYSPAMNSSTGSDAFALLAVAFISIFVLLLLRHFLPLRTTPAYLVLPVFLALALPISIILLVPIDLASSSAAEDEAARGIWLPKGVLLVAWRLTYWLTFALTWYDGFSIFPSVGDTNYSGSFFLSSVNMQTRDTGSQRIDSSVPSDPTGDINLLYWLALELVEYTSS